MTDLMAAQNRGTFVQWDGRTANIPISASGIALCFGSYETYQTILAMPAGIAALYLHITNNGSPSGWKKIDF